MTKSCPICGSASLKAMPTPYGQHQRAYCGNCHCRLRFAPNGELTYARADFDKRNYGLPALLLLAGGVLIGLLHEKIGFLGIYFSICMFGLGLIALGKYVTTRQQQKLIVRRLDELGLQSGRGHKDGAVLEAQRQIDGSSRHNIKQEQEESDDDFF